MDEMGWVMVTKQIKILFKNLCKRKVRGEGKGQGGEVGEGKHRTASKACKVIQTEPGRDS
eukprot:1145766-Pelagomonas_calceolata.AAC.1